VVSEKGGRQVLIHGSGSFTSDCAFLRDLPPAWAHKTSERSVRITAKPGNAALQPYNQLPVAQSSCGGEGDGAFKS